MRKCYLCGAEINNKNDSKEHIIPNAIGGKLVSKGLLCRNCNTKTGDEIDFELSKALRPLCNWLNIKRGRGDTPICKAELKSGDKIILKPGFKPEIVPNIKISNGKFHITARNETEAEEKLQRLKAKNPGIDIGNAIKSVQSKETYIAEPIEFKIHFDNQSLRALAKIIANFYLYRENNRNDILELVSFIKDNKKENILWPYTENSPFTFNKNGIYNVVSIIGDSDNKKLVGFIEIFNTFKFVVILNYDYRGETFLQNYCYDVEKGYCKTDIIIESGERERFFANILSKPYNISQSNYVKSINKLLDYCYKKSEAAERKRLILQALDGCKKKFPPEKNTYFTEEIIAFLIKKVSTDVAKYYIMHRPKD